jgi:hypothetical protein
LAWCGMIMSISPSASRLVTMPSMIWAERERRQVMLSTAGSVGAFPDNRLHSRQSST